MRNDGLKNTFDIISYTEKAVGMFENLFGQFTDGLVYDQQFNHNNRILIEAFKYNNVTRVFKPIQDNKNILMLVDKIFKNEQIIRKNIDDNRSE